MKSQPVMLYLAAMSATVACKTKTPDTASPTKESPAVNAFAEKQNTNRLANEKSPYLLQHAHNPVDWFPFGDEAFKRAKEENKPVFLSIGYATCHWCHVMEKESFEDPEVASLMNDTFVSIKVDREERPDVDHIYMTVCQMMTGGGGWPLTLILTPDKKPFFAATYIPKTSRYGKKGMLELIPEIASLWKKDRHRIDDSAKNITQVLSKVATVQPGEAPGVVALHSGFNQLARAFDHRHGGFGRSMKFPTPHQLLFLMRYYRQFKNEGAKEMAQKTLDAMAQGGIHDHVGFGFHRYATDPAWRVPHFEKMLYDQALLQMAYTEAYWWTKDARYRLVAERIGEYVLRDMTDPAGGFYSAEDADSEGIEGKFYLWTREEITQVLGEQDAAVVFTLFDMTKRGNFAEESGIDGANILIGKPSTDHHTATESDARFARVRKRLFEARKARVPPLKDDKILTDWNGLMIAAMAMSGRVLDRPDFTQAAVRAAAFIETNLTDASGELRHRFRDQDAALPAHLDDYAAYLFGLVELYQSTLDPVFLSRAVAVAKLLIAHFEDPDGGAFFLTADTSETILVRPKELYDGALPSGNAVAFNALVKLARITGEPKFESAAMEIARGYGKAVAESASTHTMFLSALDFAIGPSAELVVVGDPNHERTRQMIAEARKPYAPNLVVLLKDPENPALLTETAPFTASQQLKNDRPTAYVCVNQSCSFPTTDIDEMKKKLSDALSSST